MPMKGNGRCVRGLNVGSAGCEARQNSVCCFVVQTHVFAVGCGCEYAGKSLPVLISTWSPDASLLCRWMMFYLPLSLPQKGSEQMISCTCDHAFTVASIFWTSSTSCHPWGHDLGQSRLTASTQYPLLSNWPPSDFDAVFSLRSVSSCVHSHQEPKSNRAESCFTWWHPPGIWVPSPGKLLSPLSPWLTQPWAD